MPERSRIGRGLFVALAAISILTVACSRQEGDSQGLVSEVQKGLRSDPRLMMARLQVTCVLRVVTIRGYVVDEAQREAAEQDARRVKGVNVVVDDLRMADSSRLLVVIPKPQVSAARTANKLSRADSIYSALPSKPLTDHATFIQDFSAAPVATAIPERQSVDLLKPTASGSLVSIPAATTLSTAPEEATVPSGTVLVARLGESLGSDVNEKGDVFFATLASPLRVGGRVVVPDGAQVQGRVVAAQSAGRFSGKAALSVELSRLAYNGNSYDLHTNRYSRQGPSQDVRSTLKVAGGGALGAMLGAIFGGGKGAALGAIAGAGTGAGVQAARKGIAIYLPVESRFSLRLEEPLTVRPSASLQRTASSGQYFPNDPFSSDYHPVLKRRP
jgi:hypothetical protein